MEAVEVPRAVAAGVATAAALGLRVDETDLLQDTNRLALRLLPCDVLARVAPESHHESSAFEVEITRRLAATGSPVGLLEPRVEPRVYPRDGFAITLWTYYEPVPPREVAPAEYTQALERLHAGMRKVDGTLPHFTDRVAEALRLVGDRAHSPDLGDADRELLIDTLRGTTQAISERGADEQLLHGEPHPGNILRTKDGLLFVDVETCCRGPVEFDIAHAPKEVGELYPAVDRALLRECRILMLALIAAWRWDRRDRYPNGRQMGIVLISEIREARGRPAR